MCSGTCREAGKPPSIDGRVIKAVQRFRREPGMWEVTEHMTDAEIANQLRGTFSFAILRLGVASSEFVEAIRNTFSDWSLSWK